MQNVIIIGTLKTMPCKLKSKDGYSYYFILASKEDMSFNLKEPELIKCRLGKNCDDNFITKSYVGALIYIEGKIESVITGNGIDEATKIDNYVVVTRYQFLSRKVNRIEDFTILKQLFNFGDETVEELKKEGAISD